MKAYTREQQDQWFTLITRTIVDVYKNDKTMKKNLNKMVENSIEMGMAPDDAYQLLDGCITTGLAAKFLGYSDVTIAHLCDSGKIQATRTPGSHRRIKLEDLAEYLIRREKDLLDSDMKRIAVEVKAQGMVRGEEDSQVKSTESQVGLNSNPEESEEIRNVDGSTRTSLPKEGIYNIPLSDNEAHVLGTEPGEITEEQPTSDEAKKVEPTPGVGFNTMTPQPGDTGAWGRARMHSEDGKDQVKTHTGETPSELPTNEWLTGNQALAVLHIDQSALDTLRKNKSVVTKEIPVGKTKRIVYQRESVLLLRGTEIVKSKETHPRTQEFIRWYSGRYREIVGSSMPTTEVTGATAKRLVSQYNYEELKANALIFMMISRSTETEDEFYRKSGFTIQKFLSALTAMQARLATRLQSMMGNYLYSDMTPPEIDMENADSELETLERTLAYNLAVAERNKTAK
jgi:excisionase family DNA binding protein